MPIWLALIPVIVGGFGARMWYVAAKKEINSKNKNCQKTINNDKINKDEKQT